jgi:NTE family protein
MTLAALRRVGSGKLLACLRSPSARRAIVRPCPKAMFFSLLLLAGCATFNKPVNMPVAVGSSPMGQMMPPDVGGDTAVALAFSGGGMRAAAFSFGVLRGLDRLPARDGKSYLDRVIFVSGVSGGSVTAAYYGLKGRAALADFRERFLIRNAEEDLATEVSLRNIARGLDGGVNDANTLPAWLDRNLFDNALWATCFSPASRLSGSMPPIFTIERHFSFRRKRSPLYAAISESIPCRTRSPLRLPCRLRSCPLCSRAFQRRARHRCRHGSAASSPIAMRGRKYGPSPKHSRTTGSPGQIEYLKLADGGITDNFGLSGLVIARAAADKPYLPLTPEKAVRLRRVIFMVVNAGQAPAGNWAHTIDGPSGADLLNAVTDTAVNSAVRSGFDAFRLSLHDWEDSIRKWRCGLSAAEARRLGASGDWRCSSFSFQVVQVGFDLFDPQRAAKLSSIPTRLKLPTDDVDLLIQSGSEAVLNHPTFKGL